MRSIKSAIKLVSAALLVVALLSGCALVRVDPARVTVATVASTNITLEQFLEMAVPVLDAYDINPKTTDPQSETMVDATQMFIDELINQEVLNQKMQQLGITATDEDRAAAEAKLQEQVDNLAMQYVSYLSGDDLSVEEIAEMAYQYAESLYFTEEYPRERVLEETLNTVLQERMLEEQIDEVVVDDSEVRARYDAEVNYARETYLETPATFEEDYNADQYIYVPEGVIFVKHVLIMLSEEEQEQIDALRFDSKDAEADEMLAAALDRIRPLAEDVLGKAQSGVDFDSLINDYGEDPGMQAAPYSETGYMDLPGSTAFVEGFHEAAMALENDGDISGLVETPFGYHIIKRISHLEAGAVPFEVHEQTIKDLLISEKKENAYAEIVEKWRTELNVKTYLNRIDYKVDLVKE